MLPHTSGIDGNSRSAMARRSPTSVRQFGESSNQLLPPSFWNTFDLTSDDLDTRSMTMCGGDQVPELLSEHAPSKIRKKPTDTNMKTFFMNHCKSSINEYLNKKYHEYVFEPKTSLLNSSNPKTKANLLACSKNEASPDATSSSLVDSLQEETLVPIDLTRASSEDLLQSFQSLDGPMVVPLPLETVLSRDLQFPSQDLGVSNDAVASSTCDDDLSLLPPPLLSPTISMEINMLSEPISDCCWGNEPAGAGTMSHLQSNHQVGGTVQCSATPEVCRQVANKVTPETVHSSSLKPTPKKKQNYTKKGHGKRKISAMARRRNPPKSTRKVELFPTQKEEPMSTKGIEPQDIIMQDYGHSNHRTSTTCDIKGPHIRQYQHDIWAFRYKDAVQFFKENGHCNIPHHYPQNQQLARWAKRQRYQYKLYIDGDRRSAMNEERIHALKKLEFRWDSRQTHWEQRFQEYRDFLGKTKQNGPSNAWCDCSDISPSMASWVKSQRKQYRMHLAGEKTNLSQKRIDLLESISFKWLVPVKGAKPC